MAYLFIFFCRLRTLFSNCRLFFFRSVLITIFYYPSTVIPHYNLSDPIELQIDFDFQ
mgnify:CR=1 FL=1